MGCSFPQAPLRLAQRPAWFRRGGDGIEVKSHQMGRETGEQVYELLPLVGREDREFCGVQRGHLGEIRVDHGLGRVGQFDEHDAAVTVGPHPPDQAPAFQGVDQRGDARATDEQSFGEHIRGQRLAGTFDGGEHDARSDGQAVPTQRTGVGVGEPARGQDQVLRALGRRWITGRELAGERAPVDPSSNRVAPPVGGGRFGAGCPGQ